jgi:hypothetical protein
MIWRVVTVIHVLAGMMFFAFGLPVGIVMEEWGKMSRRQRNLYLFGLGLPVLWAVFWVGWWAVTGNMGG